jgi:hypothetical protein
MTRHVPVQKPLAALRVAFLRPAIGAASLGDAAAASRPTAAAAAPAAASAEKHLPAAYLRAGRLVQVAPRKAASAIAVDLSPSTADPALACRPHAAAIEAIAAAVGMTATDVAEIGTSLRRAGRTCATDADLARTTRPARFLDATAEVHRAAADHQAPVQGRAAAHRSAAAAVVSRLARGADPARRGGSAAVAHRAARREPAGGRGARSASAIHAFARPCAAAARNTAAPTRVLDGAALGDSAYGALGGGRRAHPADALLSSRTRALRRVAASIVDRSTQLCLRAGLARQRCTGLGTTRVDLAGA